MQVRTHPKEGKRGILTLTLDEEPYCDMHITIFGRRPKIPKTVSDTTQLNSLLLELEQKGAKVYAYKRLAKKNQPSTELRKALEERLVSAPIIDAIIEECTQMGYINDQEWLTTTIKHYQLKNYGPQAIQQKLRMKEIPVEQIEEALASLDNPELQKERISKLLKTRYKNRDLTDYKEKQKVIAALARKGFSFELIIDQLSSYSSSSSTR